MRPATLLLITIIAVAAVFAEPAKPPAPTKQPDLQILSLLHSIWYPIHTKPKAQPLGKRLKEQIAREAWSEAIDTAESLSAVIPVDRPSYRSDDPWEWRAAIAELYLFKGEPERAVDELEKVFEANPKPQRAGFGKSFARQSAAFVMARAMAEQGDFQAAIKWQEAAPDEYWSGCGNCMEDEQMRNRPLLAVWKRAQLPYAAAVAALERLRSGDYTSYKVRLMPAKESEQIQSALLQGEVALILGELHLRSGNLAAARRELEKASTSTLPIVFIARTRLAHLSNTGEN
jgi:tetratricopeptide (TPR) repeat protein